MVKHGLLMVTTKLDIGILHQTHQYIQKQVKVTDEAGNVSISKATVTEIKFDYTIKFDLQGGESEYDFDDMYTSDEESSIEMISYLFSKSKLLPKTLIDDMVESLLIIRVMK